MAKNKKVKYVVSIIIGIIIVIVLLNWGNIKFMFDMISSYKKYEKTENIPDDDKVFDDKNPLLEAINENKKDLNNENESADADNKENDNKSNGDENKVEKNNNNNDNNDIYVNVLAKYNDKFTSLQGEYEGELNSMISQGYSEYKSGEISKSKLISKYMSKGKALEKESDAKVNALVKEMESELKENGLDPSIAKEVRNYYTSYKENRRGEIMAKAMKAVN